MALGDIQSFKNGSFGAPGSVQFKVASGTTASINPGEPVAKTLGNSTGNVVSSDATSAQVVGTDYLAGISETTSTETASAAGVVDVTPLVGGQQWLISPTTAASWDTQSEYDALVGARVLIQKSAGIYTILASDSANNGCVVQPLDISKYPGKVAFSFRNGLNYLA